MTVADVVLLFWFVSAGITLLMMLSAYASNRPFKSVEMMSLAGLFLLFSVLMIPVTYIITEAGVANIILVDWQ